MDRLRKRFANTRKEETVWCHHRLLHQQTTVISGESLHYSFNSAERVISRFLSVAFATGPATLTFLNQFCRIPFFYIQFFFFPFRKRRLIPNGFQRSQQRPIYRLRRNKELHGVSTQMKHEQLMKCKFEQSAIAYSLEYTNDENGLK